jgi:hypothetical protein
MSTEFKFEMPKKGAKARAIINLETETKITTVLKGSVLAEDDAPSMPSRYQVLRDQLILEGIIEKKDNEWVFSTDHLFLNPSAAICVIARNSTDGYLEWKNSNGQCLNDLGYGKGI